MGKEKIYVVQLGSSVLTNQGIAHAGWEVTEKNFKGIHPDNKKKFFDDAIKRGALKLKEEKKESKKVDASDIEKDIKEAATMIKKKT